MGGAVNQAALDSVLLIRIGRSGCTQAALHKDIAPYVAHVLSPAEWRDLAARSVAGLLDHGLVVQERRSALVLTRTGCKLAGIKARGLDSDHWPHVRDTLLVARALGVTASKRVIDGFSKVDGVRLAIVQHGFSLPVAMTTPARLRQKLNGANVDWPLPKPLCPRLQSVLDAGGSDALVIARLAAELTGLGHTDGLGLRRRVIRNFVAPAAPEWLAAKAVKPIDLHPPLIADDRAAVDAVLPPAPDLPRFAATVRQLAAVNATGWQGNRRAYISHVWRAVRATQPSWDLSETKFKNLLADAHRGGHLELVNADLRDRSAVGDIEASATAYKNTVWHLIRVGET